MQRPPQTKPAVGIIFDSDLGQSVDDALALAVLYGLDGKNECRVVSISVSNPVLEAAAMSEAISRFYAGAASGAFNFAGRALPVGLAEKGPAVDSAMLKIPLARTGEDGKPVYSHGILKLTDTAEPAAMIRNAFTSQYDANAIVVLAGPATNMAQVLGVGGAKDWISRKVKFLVMVGGSFPDGKPDYNFKADLAATRKVLAEWPGPIVFVGSEIADAISFPAASIEKDFAWSNAHPVVDAYKAYKPMPYDAPTGSMAAVLYAVRNEKENYFKVSDPGNVTVTDDGASKFTPATEGKHRYIILDPSQKERILNTYKELASAKPVPRAPRVRPGQQQQQQQQQQQKPAQPLTPAPGAADPKAPVAPEAKPATP